MARGRDIIAGGVGSFLGGFARGRQARDLQRQEREKENALLNLAQTGDVSGAIRSGVSMEDALNVIKLQELQQQQQQQRQLQQEYQQQVRQQRSAAFQGASKDPVSSGIKTNAGVLQDKYMVERNADGSYKRTRVKAEDTPEGKRIIETQKKLEEAGLSVADFDPYSSGGRSKAYEAIAQKEIGEDDSFEKFKWEAVSKGITVEADDDMNTIARKIQRQDLISKAIQLKKAEPEYGGNPQTLEQYIDLLTEATQLNDPQITSDLSVIAAEAAARMSKPAVETPKEIVQQPSEASVGTPLSAAIAGPVGLSARTNPKAEISEVEIKEQEIIDAIKEQYGIKIDKPKVNLLFQYKAKYPDKSDDEIIRAMIRAGEL